MGKKLISRRKYRRPCQGDLRDRVTIQNRAITPPDLNEVDFDLSFSDAATVWASVETVSGETIFDGVGQDQTVTHVVVIRYLSGVTSESWILLDNGDRLDILDAQNFEERNEYWRLVAQRTGTQTLPVAGA